MNFTVKLANLTEFEAAIKDFWLKMKLLEDAAEELYRAATDLELEISQPTDTASPTRE